MKRSLNNLGANLGKILGDLPILVTTIFLYIILSFATYLILRCQIGNYPENQSAFLISYIVATGGDPSPYLQTLELYSFSYYWILVFHVISWLIVPVIVALAADATCRLFEKRKNLAEILLKKKMKNILSKETPLSEDEILKITEKFDEALREKEYS